MVTFAIGLTLTLAYLSLAKRVFQSEAKLLVRNGRETITLDPTATTGQYVAVGESRESDMHAVEELLASRGLAEKIVDQFGPARILEKKTGAARSATVFPGSTPITSIRSASIAFATRQSKLWERTSAFRLEKNRTCFRCRTRQKILSSLTTYSRRCCSWHGRTICGPSDERFSTIL